MSFDLKQAIGSIAPTLATMLGGPLAGAAVSALAGAFGITATGDQAKDTAAITTVMQSGNMTPDIIAAVRSADQKHLEIIGQQGIDLVKLNADHDSAMSQIDAGDRDSARKREETVRDNTPQVLAYLLTLGFFGTLAFMMVGEIPPTGHDVLLIMVGALGTAWTGMIAYFYGSTASGRTKDATIAEIAKSP